ncbi:hypothetical protein PCANC_21277 [Puccinia coronata f. sp. avenae]|uniref:Uncharacterized protein n=1 Tax=Puccinia coronata f. sp. avenae TaxID=200324 RepID=A0A2N5SDU8_9BASI|nr:hypothetical protein PCANC_21277 [Puccinia coronata f. sp. avenae]PLW50121.1 hypothetical protein PCASD_01815 [Puccinia coronata f. sp. avenae]
MSWSSGRRRVGSAHLLPDARLIGYMHFCDSTRNQKYREQLGSKNPAARSMTDSTEF